MKILFVSLGCDKNLVDSEEMLGMLSKAGHDITNEEQEADIVVVNTCAFIHDAKDESVENILEMCELKKQGLLKGVIVTGCLAQMYQQDMKNEIPEIDAILGTTSYEGIVDAVNAIEHGEYIEKFQDVNYLPKVTEHRMVTTSANMAYLKIAEGCNKYCTYCVIPKLRGKFRSVPMEDLVASAKRLVADGVKELVLVAQETTIYGVDIYGKKMLPELLKQLCAIEDLVWVRLLYCYPEEIDEALISVMASEPKICHYIDMPIQHASDEILKRMGRKTSKQEIIEKINALRLAMPDIAIRTTLITGFPGETEAHHEEVLDFIDEIEFNRLGAFTYSREDGTPAAEFDNQIDDDIKKERQDAIMELQQEISYELNQKCIGNTYQVLVEGYLFDDDVYVGRSYMDAPNVDGYVFIHSHRELMSGTMVSVEITDCNEYDLIGVLRDEFTE